MESAPAGGSESPPPGQPLGHRTVVSIATYNERPNIPGLIEAIRAALPGADVLITDDNSPDGTGQLADQLAATRPWLKVLHREGKLGLGTALMHALRWTRTQPYDYWVTMDADFSHPPEALPSLLAGMKNHDVMIGSRYVPGGGVVGWNWRRHFMSQGVNLYSRVMLGIRARDCSGAYRCYRVSKLQGFDLDQVYSTGYAFMEEFLFHCMRLGCSIGEAPIVFENRKHGKSNLNLKEMLKALWAIFHVGVRYRLGMIKPLALAAAAP